MLEVFKWLHLVGAITYIGGMITLATAVVPYARSLDAEARSQIIRGIGRKLRVVSWIAVAILILSGFGMLGMRQATSLITSDPYLLSKLLIFLVMIMLSLAHDLLLGRQATSEGGPNISMRTFASWSGRITLLLGLVIIALATQIPL